MHDTRDLERNGAMLANAWRMGMMDHVCEYLARLDTLDAVYTGYVILGHLDADDPAKPAIRFIQDLEDYLGRRSQE